jgi:hypothetical protein
MKTQLNPVVAGVIVAIVLVVVFYFAYTKASGKTFTKSEARGSMDLKVPANAGQ